MFNRLQETSHFCRLSLLLFLSITDTVDSAFYRKCFNHTEYTLCLSTDTSLSLTWNAAKTSCESNNSTLIDVSSNDVRSILIEFRKNDSLLLRNAGNWIDVTYSGWTDWHWIDGAPSGSFSVSGSQSYDELFAVISLIDNQTSFSARTYNKQLRYICQFDANADCSGGLIRDSKCYVKYSNAVSWFGASNSCLDYKGKLATFTGLHTPSSDTRLTTWLQLGANDAYWIGLIRTTFKRSNGNEMQYSYWASNHPLLTTDYGPNSCNIHSSSSEQETFNCGSTQRYVCQDIQATGRSTPTTTKTSTNSLFALQSTTSTISTATSTNVGSSSEVPIKLIVGLVVGVGGSIIVAVIVITVLRFVLKKKRALNGNKNFTSIVSESSNTDSLGESKKHPENKKIANHNDLTGVYATMVQRDISKGHNDRESRSIDFISNEPVIYAELDSNSASRS